MLARQPKRARSPTPPPSHAYGAFGESSSPLDNVFLKRQRQAAAHPFGGDLAEASYFNDQDSGRPWSPHGWSTPLEGQPEAGPSHSRPGRERRRAKQWELLNGPAFARQHPPPFAHHSNSYTSRDVASLPCQPDPLEQVDPRPSVASSASNAFSTEQLGESSSQPLMSSSPVRHTAPTSSPFRDSGQSSQMIEDDWDADELGKAWGEEYGSQNLLLRNLVSLWSLIGGHVADWTSIVPALSRIHQNRHTFKRQRHRNGPTPFAYLTPLPAPRIRQKHRPMGDPASPDQPAPLRRISSRRHTATAPPRRTSPRLRHIFPTRIRSRRPVGPRTRLT